MSGVILKLFSGGVVCAIVLSIVGSSSQREIVRLACAAFMVILIFTSGSEIRDIGKIGINVTTAEIEKQVSDAMQSSLEYQMEQISWKAARYITERVSSTGLRCDIFIEHSEGQEYTPQKITIKSNTFTAQNKTDILEIIKEVFGSQSMEIIFEEEN